MQLWAIMVDSFRDAKDRKIFWIMILISCAIAAAMACISFSNKGVDVLFGTWTFETTEWSMGNDELRANVVAIVIELIADNYLGWIGILVALVATASTFPSLTESGNIEIVASKPMARWQLFLGRYLGAMVFILLQAIVFIGLTFLVMGLRWDCWTWGYLWLIPLMVLLFSYLFAFSAFFGVWTRRSMTSLMLTIVAWFSIFAVQTTHGLLLNSPQADKTGSWTKISTAVQWFIPKTQDIPTIASKLVGDRRVVDVIDFESAGMTDHDRGQIRHAAQSDREWVAKLSPAESIGSSLAVELAVILLGMWHFNRRDF